MMWQEEADKLFREYRKTGDKNIRNKLVANYLYIAEILAKKFSGRGGGVRLPVSGRVGSADCRG